MHQLLINLIACSFAGSVAFCELPHRRCKDSWLHWISPRLAQCYTERLKCDHEQYLQCLHEKLPEDLANKIIGSCKMNYIWTDDKCVREEIENYDK